MSPGSGGFSGDCGAILEHRSITPDFSQAPHVDSLCVSHSDVPVSLLHYTCYNVYILPLLYTC